MPQIWIYAQPADRRRLRPPLYAAYSEQQRLHNLRTGYPAVCEYTKPDGSIVCCTAVSHVPGCPNPHFPDKIDLGEVVEFVGWPADGDE